MKDWPILYRLTAFSVCAGVLAGVLASGCVRISDIRCVSTEDCPEGFGCDTTRGVCVSSNLAGDAAVFDHAARADHTDVDLERVDVSTSDLSAGDAASPDQPRPDGALHLDTVAAPDHARPDLARPDAHDAGPCPLGCPGNTVCDVAADGGAGCFCPRTPCANDYCPGALECCSPDDCLDPSFSCDPVTHTCSCSGAVCADNFCAKDDACCTDTDCGAGEWSCQEHACHCDRGTCDDDYCPSSDSCCDDADCAVGFSCSSHDCTCFGEEYGGACYPATSCPCFPAGSGNDNFCHNPPETPSCPMTWPGGYCDQNENGQYDDADWVYGYYHYHAHCP